MAKQARPIISKIIWVIVFVLAFALVLSTGCGGETPGAQNPNAPQKKEKNKDEKGTYVTPEFKDSAFHADLAQSNGIMSVDVSAVNEGYVAVSGNSSVRLKFQVIKDDVTYNYDLASDGTPSVFPLQSGNGYYAFRVMENIVDNKYAVAFETGAEVAMADEFQPYLRPSDYAAYTRESECVKKAQELAYSADSAADVIGAVYDFVCKTVKYDTPKAETVESGYLPDPDETMATGKGICFDYATLAASMLRSQGIPTKIIFGYVAPDDLYHAWNMFYTTEEGWVTVEFKVDPNNWTRLDLTFSANGSNSKFIGDGTNYSDVYDY